MKCPKCNERELELVRVRPISQIYEGAKNPVQVRAWVCPDPECSAVGNKEAKRMIVERGRP